MAASGLCSAGWAGAADLASTYNGPDQGGWSVAGNWMNTPAGSFFPNNGNGGHTFDAVVAGKTVNLSNPIVIEKLTLTGGTIAGSGSLTTRNTFAWNDGALSLSGALTAANGMLLGGSAVKTIGNTTTLYNGTGTATWSGGNFSNGAFATFSNRATFNITTDADFLGGRFYNAGTFTKSAGAGETRFTSLFMNSGTVTVNTGTLAFDGGGTQTGKFNGAIGTTLRFAGGHNFPAASVHADSVIFGSGFNQFSNSSALFASNITLLPSAELQMAFAQLNSGVTLDGGAISANQTFTVTGPVVWNSGSVLSTMTVGSGISINGSAAKTLRAELFIPASPFKALGTWNGGDINTSLDPGRIEVNGSFDIRCDNTFNGSAVINNITGAITKSAGTGTTSLNSQFINYGTVAVNVGTLSLKGGGTFYQGSFNAAPGTTVRLNGDYDFRTPVNLDNLILEGGNSRFDSASANATLKSLSLQAGTVYFAHLGVDNLAVSTGTFSAGNPISNVKTLDWNGNATLSANIQTARLSISGPAGADRLLFGKLTAAETNFSEALNINIGGGSSFIVPAGGSFQLSGPGGFGGDAFVNAGTFTKTSNDQNTWSAHVTNSGSINIQSGLMRFNSVYNQTGDLTVAPGAQLVLNGPTSFDLSAVVNASSVSIENRGYATVKAIFKVTDRLTIGAPTTFLPGAVPDLTSATIAFATNGANMVLDLSSGRRVSMAGLELASGATLRGSDSFVVTDHFQWRGGTLQGTGNISVLGPATISGGGNPRIGEVKTLTLAGDSTLTTYIGLDGAATLAIAPTGTFNFMGDFAISGGTMQNAGIINRTNGTGTASINSTFNNSGTVALSVGTLAMTRGGSHAGQFLGAPGTTLVFSGPHIFASGAQVKAGSVAFSGTNGIDLAGSYTALTTTVDQTPLTLRGTLTFAPGATLALTNGAALDLRSDAGSPATSNLALSIANASVAISVTQHLASLSISGTAASSVTLSRSSAQMASPSVLVTRALEISEKGNLQIDNNALIVDDDSTGASSTAKVRAQIIAGYDPAASGHFASGVGITSAAAASNASAAIGYANASEVLSFTGEHASFLGQEVDASSTLARYALYGDATLDGAVDFNDLVKLAQNYNTTVSSTTDSWWTHGDFTYDGVTDFNDLVKLAQNYNSALPSQAIPGSPASFQAELARAFASVPEPSILSVLGLSLAVHRRRRR